jgi:hypothetical protein
MIDGLQRRSKVDRSCEFSTRDSAETIPIGFLHSRLEPLVALNPIAQNTTGLADPYCIGLAGCFRPLLLVNCGRESLPSRTLRCAVKRVSFRYAQNDTSWQHRQCPNMSPPRSPPPRIGCQLVSPIESPRMPGKGVSIAFLRADGTIPRVRSRCQTQIHPNYQLMSAVLERTAKERNPGKKANFIGRFTRPGLRLSGIERPCGKQVAISRILTAVMRLPVERR